MTTLGTQGISVKNCLLCCEIAQNKAFGTLNELVAKLLDVIVNPPSKRFSLALAFAPMSAAVQTAPRVVTVAETGLGPAVPGILVLLTYETLAPLLETKASLDVLSAIGAAIGVMFGKRPVEDRCLECIAQHAWRQDHPRKRMIAKINRRL